MPWSVFDSISLDKLYVVWKRWVIQYHLFWDPYITATTVDTELIQTCYCGSKGFSTHEGNTTGLPLMPKKKNVPWKLHVSISSVHSDFLVITCKGDQGYDCEQKTLRAVIFLFYVHFPRACAPKWGCVQVNEGTPRVCGSVQTYSMLCCQSNSSLFQSLSCHSPWLFKQFSRYQRHHHISSISQALDDILIANYSEFWFILSCLTNQKITLHQKKKKKSTSLLLHTTFGFMRRMISLCYLIGCH